MNAEGMNIDYYDEDAIILDCNTSAYPPCPAVFGAIDEALQNNVLHRYPRIDPKELITKIAFYQQVPDDHVLLTAGADAAIDLILSAHKNEYTFVRRRFTYSYIVNKAGGVIVPETEPFDFRHSWVAEDNRSGNIIYMANPDNPTGVACTTNDLFGFLSDGGGRFIVDESYAEYAEDMPDSSLTKSIYSERVFRVRTFSKAFGLASVRIGYIIAHPANIHKLRQFHNPKSINSLAQVAAFQAIVKQEHMRGVVEKTHVTRDDTVRRIKSMGYANVKNTQLNFFLIGLVRPYMLHDYLRNERVYVRRLDAEYFGSVDYDFPYLRVTVGTQLQMDSLIDALKGYEGSRI